MSVTEWVLNTYNSDENGLEESKNFAFIWSLFESQVNNSIGNLRTDNFEIWTQNLLVTQEQNGISIKEPDTENSIDGNLIDYINKAFNHFNQKYTNDNSQFTNHLFNRTDRLTQDAKTRFLNYTNSLNKRDIRDKIVFLFHIAKRMRNKFFHGIKNIGEIKSEQIEFKKINEYLISILSLVEQYN